MKNFQVIGQRAIIEILSANPELAVRAASEAYLAMEAKQAINPQSQFLRFPGSDARIISLPAAFVGDRAVAGLKWISSFPKNISADLPRASAVLILNDPENGYPIGCLESSVISAARTAGSAVLGAYWMNNGKRAAKTISLVGAGVISRSILDTFLSNGWSFEKLQICDVDQHSEQSFRRYFSSHGGYNVEAVDLRTALSSEIVVLATNAGVPHISDPDTFKAGQIVLHVSLRDLSPSVIAKAWNMVDDVEHALRERTSLHLAEMALGHREFVAGTIAQLMLGEITIDSTRPLIFSPFGLGLLDLLLGRDIYELAVQAGGATAIVDFFGDCKRW